MCTKRPDFYHVTGRFEENNVRVVELNVSPKFYMMKQVVLKKYSAQSTKTSTSNNIKKRFRIASSFTWNVKD